MKDKREALKREVNDVYWEGYPEPKLGSLYAYSMQHQHRIGRIADFILARERSMRETMGKVREVLEAEIKEQLTCPRGLMDEIHSLKVCLNKALALLNEAEGNDSHHYKVIDGHASPIGGFQGQDPCEVPQ